MLGRTGMFVFLPPLTKKARASDDYSDRIG